MSAPDVVRVDAPDGAARADQPAPGSQRAVPYHCPFCAEELLRPHEAARGAWHCRSCLRIFTVQFLGLAAVGADPFEEVVR